MADGQRKVARKAWTECYRYRWVIAVPGERDVRLRGQNTTKDDAPQGGWMRVSSGG